MTDLVSAKHLGQLIGLRRALLYAGVDDKSWNDWRWQLQNAVRTPEALAKVIALDADELASLRVGAASFRMTIPPYYLCLIDPTQRWCPVRLQALPSIAETATHAGERADPLGEDLHRPVPCLIHKYPDRALLLVTQVCPMYCRHCTRRRITRGGADSYPGLGANELGKAIAYLRAHHEIREVLISGGDPLMLSDAKLEGILSALRAVPHVEVLRIGTRAPVTLPMRVTTNLAACLRRFAPLFVITHFNHPKEVTAEAQSACERLVDAGIPVENQTVLMRRLNSDARIIRELNLRCLAMRVRPYYLHQMDVIEGGEHLRTPIAKGIEIIAALRGFSSGLAVPHLAIDLPGGGGKVTLQPEYRIGRSVGSTVFRSFRGGEFAYPDASDEDCSCPYDAQWIAMR